MQHDKNSPNGCVAKQGNHVIKLKTLHALKCWGQSIY
jgi:hypothetical protein